MSFGDPETLALNVMNALLGLLVIVPILAVLEPILLSFVRHNPADIGHGLTRRATRRLATPSA